MMRIYSTPGWTEHVEAILRAADNRSRAENLAKVRSFEGQRGALARDAYTKCVDITPEMAYQFIKVSLRPSCIIATRPWGCAKLTNRL